MLAKSLPEGSGLTIDWNVLARLGRLQVDNDVVLAR